MKLYGLVAECPGEDSSGMAPVWSPDLYRSREQAKAAMRKFVKLALPGAKGWRRFSNVRVIEYRVADEEPHVASAPLVGCDPDQMSDGDVFCRTHNQEYSACRSGYDLHARLDAQREDT